jgi:enoyl-CoA hydratase
VSVLCLDQHPLSGGVVAVITLNRPDRLNTITREMLDDLGGILARLSHDPQVRVLIVTGGGDRAFCAGADITLFSEMTPIEAEEFMAYGQTVFQAIEDAPKPVIAAINGYCLGGGLELALACDFRVASKSATFGMPEITLANVPGWGGTQRLPRVVGEPIAKELIMTGRFVGATEALALHLVHQVADGAVLDHALRFADRLAQHASVALTLAKRAIHAARTDSETGYAVESEAVGLCFTTSEQKTAIRDFFENKARRATSWRE